MNLTKKNYSSFPEHTKKMFFNQKKKSLVNKWIYKKNSLKFSCPSRFWSICKWLLLFEVVIFFNSLQLWLLFTMIFFNSVNIKFYSKNIYSYCSIMNYCEGDYIFGKIYYDHAYSLLMCLFSDWNGVIWSKTDYWL
jgi:hypothetical protein